MPTPAVAQTRVFDGALDVDLRGVNNFARVDVDKSSWHELVISAFVAMIVASEAIMEPLLRLSQNARATR